MRAAVGALVESIDEVTFSITDNELSYGEHKALFDIYANLKFAKEEEMRQLNFKNKTLLVAMESSEAS